MKLPGSLLIFLILTLPLLPAKGQQKTQAFQVQGFHLDLRVQVMPMKQLQQFATSLRKRGLNTLILEWESSFPFEKHPLISGRYAYSIQEVKTFLQHCTSIGLDVIPLQQTFGHVEYILRHQRYQDLREDDHDYSQVCPLKAKGDSLLFLDLFRELAAVHSSPYIHIGGDETYLLGHDKRCQEKVSREGKGKLYGDYVKKICDIVVSLGKRPLVWADIALKYPESISQLPRETIFVDWNYGWELNRFGDHDKLRNSGYEIWGAPSIRSSPDNYCITQWEKHFNNIRDFVPLAKTMGYTGMILTSWSTSGIYSSVFESHHNLQELHAVRRVYPLSGFDILIDAFCEKLDHLAEPLNVDAFITSYAQRHFKLNPTEAKDFSRILRLPQHDVDEGRVLSDSMSLDELYALNKSCVNTLKSLSPSLNKPDFEQIRLMFDIRDFYLRYELIQAKANSTDAGRPGEIQPLIQSLQRMIEESRTLDTRFMDANKNYLHPSELLEENRVRNYRVISLYNRLARNK